MSTIIKIQTERNANLSRVRKEFDDKMRQVVAVPKELQNKPEKVLTNKELCTIM